MMAYKRQLQRLQDRQCSPSSEWRCSGNRCSVNGLFNNSVQPGWLHPAFQTPEPYAGKLARTVPGGLGAGNSSRLLDGSRTLHG